MKEFVDTVTAQLEEAKANYEKAEKLFTKTKNYFSARKTMSSDELFVLFDKFLTYYRACDQQYEAEILKKQKEKKQGRGTLTKRENAGKKIGGGAGGDGDPMMGIIAAIRAGKASGLKKSDLPAARTASTENDEEPASAGNPFTFQLRKVERPPPKEKEEEEPMNELQKMLSKRK